MGKQTNWDTYSNRNSLSLNVILVHIKVFIQLNKKSIKIPLRKLTKDMKKQIPEIEHTTG